MLDTETVSSFSTGVYLQWTVSGNIVIKMTNLSGPNAVLSGLFIDSASSSGSTNWAKPNGQNTTDGGELDRDLRDRRLRCDQQRKQPVPANVTVTPAGETP